MSDARNSDYDVCEPLVIGNTTVDYNRQLVDQQTKLVSIKSRLFLNDPWELIAKAISKKLPPGKERDIAQSFQLQAEDYFHAATTGRELAVKPVLLYYGVLNLSKVYGMLAGRNVFTGQVFHGIQCKLNRNSLIDTEITFNSGNNQVSAFRELLQLLGAKFTVLPKSIPLGYILPQRRISSSLI
jgi:hypothetical protein